mgnify:CR=1 FL=1
MKKIKSIRRAVRRGHVKLVPLDKLQSFIMLRRSNNGKWTKYEY